MAIFKVLAFAASCVGLVAAFSSPPELDEFNGLKISTGISTQLEGIFKLPRKFQKQQILNLFLHQQEQSNKQIDKLVNLTNFLSGELRSVTDEKVTLSHKFGIMLLRAEMEDIKKRFLSEMKTEDKAKKDEEKGLSNEAIAWKRLAESKSEEPEMRIIKNELKKYDITPRDFGITTARLWNYLCDQIHNILSNPDVDLQPLSGSFPDRFLPEVTIINKLFRTTRVQLRGKPESDQKFDV